MPTLVEQSLEKGDPFPGTSTVPLVATCIKHNKAFAGEEAGQRMLGVDTVEEESFRKDSVVLSAFIQLRGAADGLVWRVKNAISETSY